MSQLSYAFEGNFLNVVQVIAECRGFRARCDRLEEIGLQREQSEQGIPQVVPGERIKGYHCFANEWYRSEAADLQNGRRPQGETTFGRGARKKGTTD